MTNRANLRLQGAKELDKLLRQLPGKVAKRIVSKALRAGAKVIQAAAKKLAPKESGLLRRSIKVRAARRKKGRVGFVIGTKEGDYKGKAFYGSFIEWGHKLGSRKLGNKRKQVPAEPYLEPALRQEAVNATNKIADEIRKGIQAVVAA